jgi:hypothetical protein
LLTGLIFDDRGTRMTPSYVIKKGVRYRYYISAALLHGQADKASTLNRVPAVGIEKLIAAAVRKRLEARPSHDPTEEPGSITDKELIATHVVRVEVRPDHLFVQLTKQQGGKADTDGASSLVIPWKKTPAKRPREIIPPALTSPRQDRRPIRAETRAKLITAIAKGRLWLEELCAGTVDDVKQIADRENCSIRQVHRTITLAFLAPSLVQAAVDGRLPRGIGVASLRDLPAEWVRQHEKLGLAS